MNGLKSNAASNLETFSNFLNHLVNQYPSLPNLQINGILQMLIHIGSYFKMHLKPLPNQQQNEVLTGAST